MQYLLDTNICIYIIKHQPPAVLSKFKNLSPDDIGISSITYAELLYGVEKSQHINKNRDALEKFVLPLEVFLFDDVAAQYYGKVRATLEKKGTPIGSLDLLIAAHALSLNLKLVTNNVKEFSRVPNLHVENWAKENR